MYTQLPKDRHPLSFQTSFSTVCRHSSVLETGVRQEVALLQSESSFYLCKVRMTKGCVAI